MQVHTILSLESTEQECIVIVLYLTKRFTCWRVESYLSFILEACVASPSAMIEVANTSAQNCKAPTLSHEARECASCSGNILNQHRKVFEKASQIHLVIDRGTYIFSNHSKL